MITGKDDFTEEKRDEAEDRSSAQDEPEASLESVPDENKHH